MNHSSQRRFTFGIQHFMIAIALFAVCLSILMWVMNSRLGWGISQAFDLAAYFLPRWKWASYATTLVALIALICDRRTWRIRSMLLFLPYSIPMAILLFGEAFDHNRGYSRTVTTWCAFLLEWSTWLHLPVGLFLIANFRSPSYWLIIACILVGATWLSRGAIVLSWMMVTDIWL
ncbi:hypothetical protein [Singulisphaera sp. PoT]|uniref:hypothetical protein n=1 Tax=Singulisphaera sp. PoT TaxID=3411797 RepID=UPI003BF48144